MKNLNIKKWFAGSMLLLSIIMIIPINASADEGAVNMEARVELENQLKAKQLELITVLNKMLVAVQIEYVNVLEQKLKNLQMQFIVTLQNKVLVLQAQLDALNK